MSKAIDAPAAVHRFLSVHDASLGVARAQLRQPRGRLATALAIASRLVENHQRFDDFGVGTTASIEPSQQLLGFVAVAAANQIVGVIQAIGSACVRALPVLVGGSVVLATFAGRRSLCIFRATRCCCDSSMHSFRSVMNSVIPASLPWRTKLARVE